MGSITFATVLLRLPWPHAIRRRTPMSDPSYCRENTTVLGVEMAHVLLITLLLLIITTALEWIVLPEAITPLAMETLTPSPETWKEWRV